jgi:hypothetical protein
MNARRSVSLSIFAFGFMILPSPSLSAVPLDSSSRQATKPIPTLTGEVSENGALLISEVDRKTYRVRNSDTLRHLEGEYVMLQARYLSARRQLYIPAVRTG